jgi:hypothetical protein
MQGDRYHRVFAALAPGEPIAHSPHIWKLRS